MRNPPPLSEKQVRILKGGSIEKAGRLALGISEFFDVKLGRNYHETFEWVAAQTGMREPEWDALLYEATEDSESY
jgi:hypothetical protein